MTFTSAVSYCLSNYATFSGRASRSEFWWFYLFQFLLGIILGLLLPEGLVFLAMLALVVPSLACSTRRLRDANYSPWWQMLLFTFFGMVILWFLWAQPSSSNEYTPFREA